MITKNRQTKKVCSGDKLSKITGLELCAEIQYPNASLKADAPYFPLTGPISAGITLHKRDTHTSYNLEYKLVKVDSCIHIFYDKIVSCYHFNKIKLSHLN